MADATPAQKKDNKKFHYTFISVCLFAGVFSLLLAAGRIAAIHFGDQETTSIILQDCSMKGRHSSGIQFMPFHYNCTGKNNRGESIAVATSKKPPYRDITIQTYRFGPFVYSEPTDQTLQLSGVDRKAAYVFDKIILGILIFGIAGVLFKFRHKYLKI